MRRLLDIQAISELKYRYCAYCDDNYDADGIASCYAEDGVMGSVGAPLYEGREAIRTLFKTAPSTYLFAIHSVSNPIIKVDGDTATGSWKLFQPCTLAHEGGPRAVWIAGNYADTYVRKDGRWLIQRCIVTLHFVSPFDEGWVKQRFMA
jgi:ketosteroid isomerase-like protein